MRTLLLALTTWLLAAACAETTPEPAPAPTTTATVIELPRLLSVASFNVRYGTADDGEDRWELREELVLAEAERLTPGVLAVQEALDFQVDALLERLPRLTKIGQHREGGTRGEFSGLLVDQTVFEVEASGDLWLSETPDEVGSVGWDAALTRSATWVRLADRTTPLRFVAIGTHFDHRGERARLESARLLARELERLCREGAGPDGRPLPGLLLGDLNAGEDSAPLAALGEAGLVDTFRVVHPDAVDVGTFNGFADRSDGAKIDFVLATDGWQVHDAGISRPRGPVETSDVEDPSDEDDTAVGRCASDHDVPWAVLSQPLGGGR